jgi:hypothetical protein
MCFDGAQAGLEDLNLDASQFLDLVDAFWQIRLVNHRLGVRLFCRALEEAEGQLFVKVLDVGIVIVADGVFRGLLEYLLADTKVRSSELCEKTDSTTT